MFTTMKSAFANAFFSKDDLLEQKYIDLATTFDRLKLNPDIEKQFPDHCAKITEVLAQTKHWDNANIVEQMLAPMYSAAELEIEIKLRLIEARRRLGEAMVTFFESEAETLQSKEERLNLLCCMYKQLHISYDLEVHKKTAIAGIRLSTSLAFLLSILMYFLLEKLDFMQLVLNPEHSHKTDFVIVAFTSGWMGSCFSMLLRIKGNIEEQTLAELQATARFDNLLARSLIGVVSGMLVFYAMEATMFQGALFPSLVFDNAGNFIADSEVPGALNKANGMVTFWAFVAGFSEKLVPDLLSKSEEQAKLEAS